MAVTEICAVLLFRLLCIYRVAAIYRYLSNLCSFTVYYGNKTSVRKLVFSAIAIEEVLQLIHSLYVVVVFSTPEKLFELLPRLLL